MKPTRTLLPVLLACGAALCASSAFANSPEKKLDKLDTNNDGQISRAEHTAGVQQMFSRLDADNDGVVTATEAEAGKGAPHNGSVHNDNVTRNNPESQERLGHEKFQRLDKNSDGRVTLEEAANGCDAMFDKEDTNRDGTLSREELAAGHKAKKDAKKDVQY